MNVQGYFLNKRTKLYFENDFFLNYEKKKYCYDCLDTFEDLQSCKEGKTGIMFHFLQPNHFAFDSMLYDGSINALVLIQITINSQHKIHYKRIESLMNGISVSLEKVPSDYKKYIQFFQELGRREIGETLFFQWLTDKKYEALETRSKKKNDAVDLFKGIYCFNKELIDEINNNI